MKMQNSKCKIQNFGTLRVDCIMRNAKCEMKLPVVRGQVPVEERWRVDCKLS